jgi:pimeloyl-ACP methyl ester carboxylesterase
MHDGHPCDEPCALACAEACALRPASERIVLADALARWRQEASHGTCDTGRYRMRFFTWGDGPPLVLIPGIADSRRSFVQPASRLAADFRCVGYDLPVGDGDGARLRCLTHADFVADLWALLDHLGLKQAYVFGSSFGSTIALAAVAERPERLPRAVLQGALAYRPLRRAEWLLAWLGRALPGRLAHLPFRAGVARALVNPGFDERGPDAFDYFQEVSGRSPLRAVAHQLMLLHRLDLRPLLPRVRQPVLLLCGDGDRLAPPSCADELLHGLPSAGRVTIENCGHAPSYTHPEIVAEVVRQFLTPPAPATAPSGVAGAGGPTGG